MTKAKLSRGKGNTRAEWDDFSLMENENSGYLSSPDDDPFVTPSPNRKIEGTPKRYVDTVVAMPPSATRPESMNMICNMQTLCGKVDTMMSKMERVIATQQAQPHRELATAPLDELVDQLAEKVAVRLNLGMQTAWSNELSEIKLSMNHIGEQVYTG